MTIFKKMKKQPVLFTYLDLDYSNAKEKGETSFYHALYKDERDLAEKWCKKNNVALELSHKTNDAYFYKFIIL